MAPPKLPTSSTSLPSESTPARRPSRPTAFSTPTNTATPASTPNTSFADTSTPPSLTNPPPYPTAPELSNETNYHPNTATLFIIINTSLALHPMHPIPPPTPHIPTKSTTAVSTPGSNQATTVLQETKTTARWQHIPFYTRRTLLGPHIEITRPKKKKVVTAWTRFVLPERGRRVARMVFKFVDVEHRGDVREVVVDLEDEDLDVDEEVERTVGELEREVERDRRRARDEYVGKVTGGRMDSRGSLRRG